MCMVTQQAVSHCNFLIDWLKQKHHLFPCIKFLHNQWEAHQWTRRIVYSIGKQLPENTAAIQPSVVVTMTF